MVFKRAIIRCLGTLFWLLGLMNRFVSNIIIALGVLILIAGTVSTPLVQNLMPLTIPFIGNAHTYYRVVPASPGPPNYVYVGIIVIGVLIIISGVMFRRRSVS